ncbi:MAG: hypothetical protein OHK0011_22200 [Turneriella sp.]
MTLRAEWLKPGLTAIWLMAIVSALPQLAGLSRIAVAAPVTPLWRTIAQILLLTPLLLMIFADRKKGWRTQAGDVFLLICIVLYAHLPSPFFDYIWDVCLIEATFVYLVSRSLQLTESWRHWHVWPMRLLLFKLMFSMGVIKYLHGMPEWRNGTALTFFWANQPMPGYLAWYAAQLPVGAQKVMSALVFMAEIPGPFLLFCGPKARKLFFLMNLILQLGIFVTGNYGWFNLLTIVVSFSLFEPRQNLAISKQEFAAERGKLISVAKVWGLAVLTCWLMTSAWYQYAVFFPGTRNLPETSWVFLKNPEQEALPKPLLALLQVFAAAKASNPYALFGHISKYRMEIELWGSYDRREWKKYRFKIKPDETDRAPIWYAPHHWRLDHQLYYESFRIRAPQLTQRYSFFLGNAWMKNFLRALFYNDESVTALFGENPFAHRAPQFLQLRYKYYAFTDAAEWRLTGNYWKNDTPHAGQFFAEPFSLHELGRLP